MPQPQWETPWPQYSAQMHYPLVSGQPPPGSVVARSEPPPVETVRHEPQQPVVQPPKPPDAELPTPPVQAQVNGNLNGSASQEKQKPYTIANANGAQLPDEFNFLKVGKSERVGRTGLKSPPSSSWNPIGLSCSLRICSTMNRYRMVPHGR